MQQAISPQKIHVFGHDSFASGTRINGFAKKFITWCDMQERKRILWLAISLVGGIATILPLTLMAIVLAAGNNFNLWVIACIINVPILVVNLAAQPTKIILPVIFVAWIIDAIIIAYCLVFFFVS